MSILSRLFPKPTPAGGTPVVPAEGSAARADHAAEVDADLTPADPASQSSTASAASEATGVSPSAAAPAKKHRDHKEPKDAGKDVGKDQRHPARTTLIGPTAPATPTTGVPALPGARRGQTTQRRDKPAAEPPGAAARAPERLAIPSEIEASVDQALEQILTLPAGAPNASPTTAAPASPPAPPAPRQTPASIPQTTSAAEPRKTGELVTPAAAAPAPSAAPPPWTTADRAAARATFEDLSKDHARPVRNLMLELEWGVPAPAWMVASRGALASLRRMADQVELPEASDAIGALMSLLDQAIVDGAVTDDVGRRLQTAYANLARTLPRAFELGNERDRREALLVQALLGQVPGLEPLLVQRLFAVGLGRLDALLRATAEEVAVVADLPAPVASALVDKAQELRQQTGGERDLTDARRVLGPLLTTLKRQQHDYARAAQGWSTDNLTAKRQHRREREQTFLKLKVAITRLGDVDFALRLQTYSYARRIDELEQYLQQAGGLARAS